MNYPERWQKDKSAKELTSMKVGGALHFYSRPKTVSELQEDLATAQVAALPIRVIGAGSNLLFADAGFTGLVIQPALTTLTVLEERQAEPYQELVKAFHATSQAEPRYRPGEEEGVLELNEADALEKGEPTLVEMGAGVPWGQAVMWSIQQQLIGLQWYARIPCQVGGAVFNNIHGEKHLLSEVIVGVKALDLTTGEERIFGIQELDFGYDHSRFHTRREVVTAAIFLLERVSPAAAHNAKSLYLNWTAEKTRVQPAGANCGSVFQNISPTQAQEIGQTPLAAAWYVDQCGMKGSRVGGMQVYEKHANFIINDGSGTQADFIALVQKIRLAVHERFGIWLEPEAECIDPQGNRLTW